MNLFKINYHSTNIYKNHRFKSIEFDLILNFLCRFFITIFFLYLNLSNKIIFII